MPPNYVYAYEHAHVSADGPLLLSGILKDSLEKDTWDMSVLKGRLGDSASVFVNVLYDFPKYLNQKCLLFECLCFIITHGMFYNGNVTPVLGGASI